MTLRMYFYTAVFLRFPIPGDYDREVRGVADKVKTKQQSKAHNATVIIRQLKPKTKPMHTAEIDQHLELASDYQSERAYE